SFAQWYSANLSADIRKSKLEQARRGISNGRPPLGYHYDPPGSWRRGSRWGGEEERHCECTDRRSWTTCDQAAPVIAHIFSEYASGTVSVGDLVRDLNGAGVLDRRWNHATVNRILKSPTYVGYVVSAQSDEMFVGRQPAIVEQPMFDR